MIRFPTVSYVVLFVLASFSCGPVGSALAADEATWPGRREQWHGFDQYHFEVDGRKCYVVVPQKAAHGRPWVWRARFPEYHADADITLVGRGFHIAYVDVAGLFGSPQALDYGDAFYALLTSRHGLSKKPALEGVSRGGLFVYNWAARNPDKVACIYADTPVLDFKSWPGGKGNGLGSPREWQKCLEVYGLTEAQALDYDKNPVDQVATIAKARIPILHIVSENDRVVPPEENTRLFADRIPESIRRHQFRIITVREGTAETHGHHFRHPSFGRVVDFMVQHAIYEGGYASTSVSRTLEEIEAIYQTLPPLDYVPPAERGKSLQRTRERLKRGGTLKIVMLGDSIINDTSRSQWHLLLQAAHPPCQISKVTSVRGSTGCWWYKDNQRLVPYVFDMQPDLVIIGGISNRNDVDSIGEVVRQIQAASEAEILLVSGVFGSVDPRDDKWQFEIDEHSHSYRAQLQRLARELEVEFLDMHAPWGRYIRESGKELDWFKRDPIHANDKGEQIIGRILYRYLAAHDESL